MLDFRPCTARWNTVSLEGRLGAGSRGVNGRVTSPARANEVEQPGRLGMNGRGLVTACRERRGRAGGGILGCLSGHGRACSKWLVLPLLLRGKRHEAGVEYG